MVQKFFRIVYTTSAFPSSHQPSFQASVCVCPPGWHRAFSEVAFKSFGRIGPEAPYRWGPIGPSFFQAGAICPCSRWRRGQHGRFCTPIYRAWLGQSQGSRFPGERGCDGRDAVALCGFLPILYCRSCPSVLTCRLSSAGCRLIVPVTSLVAQMG